MTFILLTYESPSMWIHMPEHCNIYHILSKFKSNHWIYTSLFHLACKVESMVTDNKSYWLKVPAKLPAEHLGDTLLNVAVSVGAGTAYGKSVKYSDEKDSLLYLQRLIKHNFCTIIVTISFFFPELNNK